MDKPDPIEAIKFRMDQQGLSYADMKQYIGSASKVSEVLNRKRPLSLSMIRRLHDGLGIPADILIQDMSAIEWSLVDAEEEETAMTSVIARCESAVTSPSAYFAEKATESYFFKKMLFSAVRGNDKCKEKNGMFFSLISNLSSSFTAASNLNDEMTSDGNYLLLP
ncbi:transcriptional regulator [Escherichia coli]